MVLFNILAAFGAGALAASIGAVNAFIMTGILAIVAGVLTCLGLDAGFTAAVAFGTVMGPHMSFAAGAAATAYAKKKGYIDNGCALGQGLTYLGKADVLVIGGVFGIIAYLIADFVVAKIFGGLIPFGTDNPGMTVVISGIIARLAFTDNGVKSKNPTFMAKGEALTALLVRNRSVPDGWRHRCCSERCWLLPGWLQPDPVRSGCCLPDLPRHGLLASHRHHLRLRYHDRCWRWPGRCCCCPVRCCRWYPGCSAVQH